MRVKSKVVMALEDWAVVRVGAPHGPPGRCVPCLVGKLPGGEPVRTSPIVGREGGDIAVTRSGSRYQLGKPHPDYERRFPAAKTRLMENLPDLTHAKSGTSPGGGQGRDNFMDTTDKQSMNAASAANKAGGGPVGNQTLLVTGGAGFIGSHVTRRLLAAGYRVVVLDNLVNGHSEALRDCGAELVPGDIGNQRLVLSLLLQHEIRGVLHFAGYCYVGESVRMPLKYYLNNVAAPLALLDAIRQTGGVIPLVFSSTCATYGEPDSLPISERQAQAPVNPYGRSKLMFESILRDCGEAFGLRSACLRYFNASGCDPEAGLGEEHDPETHAIPLILRAAAGLSAGFSIFGTDYDTPDGTCVRDFIHVKDLAEAHLLAMRNLLDGGASLACNLGTGRGTSVKDLVRLAEEVTGLSVPVTSGPRRPGDPAVLVADPSLARQLLGWKARITDVREHISDTWRWMRGPRWRLLKNAPPPAVPR
jgi:UDP-glucose-4-epimerase GalE